MNPSNVSPPNPGATPPNPPPTPSHPSSSSPTAQMKEAAREKAQQLKGTAAQAADQAKTRAADMIGERRNQVADRLGGYSSAIHQSAQSLEEQDPNIAWFTHQAAEKIDRVADYVRNRDFNALRADAEDFGRRHPAVLLGGLFLAGFVLGTAIKAGRNASDEQARDEADFEYTYDPEMMPGEAMTSTTPPISSSSEI